MKRALLYILMCFTCFSCDPSREGKKKELLVYSAASLTNVISELAERYELSSESDIHLNFASSGTLARQIEHGAEPCIYISANRKWVEYLSGLDLVLPGSTQILAENTLALIVPQNSKLDSVAFNPNLMDSFAGRFAIGNPKHVPAGDYAWQAIKNAGLEKSLEEYILPTKDVRSALMLVELGEAEMGIVYRTDALRSNKVRVVAAIPGELHAPVLLYAAILKEKNSKETQHFYNFLRSNEAKQIWKKHGFKIE